MPTDLLDGQIPTVATPSVPVVPIDGVAGGESGGFAAADIYEHGFEDSSTGEFNNGAGQSILVSTGKWVVDTTDAGVGSNSVMTVIPTSAGNQSFNIYYGAGGVTNAVPALEFYTRFYMKQDSAFSNGDDIKIDRVQGTFNGNWGTLFVRGSVAGAPFAYNWDNFEGTTIAMNQNLPAPTADDNRGAWHYYEVHRNITDLNNMRVRVWIDGTLYLDDTRSSNTFPSNFSFNRNVWWPTVNSMPSASSIWMDHIALSTERTGAAT